MRFRQFPPFGSKNNQPKLQTCSAALLLLLLSTIFSSQLSWCQTGATDVGTIIGLVTDPTGAVVSRATVILTDTGTGVKRTTNTNDTGTYIFPKILPGTYDIAVSHPGFSEARATGQVVQVGRQLTANIQLQVGTANQVVEVQTTGTELQTLNATIGSTVSSTALENLPNLARDVDTFVTLQPAVSPDGSVAGAVVDQSTFMLDGGNNTNDMDGSMQVYTPSFAGDPTGGLIYNDSQLYGRFLGAGPTGVMPVPQDSVEEFKVATTGQTAEFSNSAGMQAMVVTKRGTNAWHGTVYENYLNNNFSGNTWDNKNCCATVVPQPDWHQNWFGAAVGGPIIPKEILGGKTYVFANYQGFRWNNSETFERAIPSADMRNGFLTFNGVRYDLNALDPRGIGINPTVQAMWNKYLPVSLANDPSCGTLIGSRCDGVNQLGFRANLSIPQNDNFGVVRLDHNFGSKWHFMSSFRYYHLTRATHNQVDIGGFFSGDTPGVPTALTNRPQVPWYLVAGITTNISSNVTNDFHYSFIRNWWGWSSAGAPPQFPELAAALEPLGESRTSALTPYNVDTQNTRTRFWDGKDHFISDDVSMLKGSHLFHIGGQYQHNFNYHQRTDNGAGINYYPVYLLGDSSGSGQVDVSAICGQFNIGCTTKSTRDIAAVLGMVTLSQQAYTRTVPNLALNPPLTPAFAKSTIPYYNVYFSDSWKIKPSFTLTYGLGWMLEMPPVEENGRQVTLVDANGQQIDSAAYLNQRKAAALNGQVFNPPIGFALVGKTNGGLKYPYNPFYHSFSPRIAFAWNPEFGGSRDTVFRGGYSRIYGRLNGVNQVLVPLLAPGLIQPVTCVNALRDGTCNASVTPDSSTAFRVGIDGNSAPLPAASQTLPQPYLPGINDVNAGAGEALDPNFRPNSVDVFNFSIQHQFSPRFTVELGAISRWIHNEYQPININAVPHMMTLGGQSFASAYAAVEKAMGCANSQVACQNATTAATLASLTPQPFFEAALAGTGYCDGFANCTAAIVNGEFSNFQSQAVWSLWSDLDRGGGTGSMGWNFPRSMMNTPIAGTAVLPPCSGLPCGVNGQLSGGVGVNASVGHGNYNAGFLSVTMNSWHGLTMQQNLTWSKALGTGALVQATSEYTPVDPFDIDKGYGVQTYDRRLVYTSFFVFQPQIYRGQEGFRGHLMGGWSFSPVFTAGSGAPIPCNTNTGDYGDLALSGAEEFGAGTSAFFGTTANCIFTKSPGGATVHYGVQGNSDSGVGTAVNGTGGAAANIFADPNAVWNTVRPPILGIDNRTGGAGSIYGLPYWNLDLSIAKNVRITERFSTEASLIFTNVLNHNVLLDPFLDLTNPSGWGVMNTQGNIPRRIGFSIRVNF
jgi:carboxypeptidase family protein